MAQKHVGMTVFSANACPWEQEVAVFTIKQLKQAIATCEHALNVSQVFGVELKPVLPSFFFCTPDFFFF